MTKLLEWLTGLLLMATVWVAAYTNTIDLCCHRWKVLWSPIIMIVLFGLYSVITIAYRYTKSYDLAFTN